MQISRCRVAGHSVRYKCPLYSANCPSHELLTDVGPFLCPWCLLVPTTLASIIHHALLAVRLACSQVQVEVEVEVEVEKLVPCFRKATRERFYASRRHMVHRQDYAVTAAVKARDEA